MTDHAHDPAPPLDLDLDAIERRHFVDPAGFATGATAVDPDVRALLAECRRLRAERDTDRAENERLRAALWKTVQQFEGHGYFICADQARAALAGPGSEA